MAARTRSGAGGLSARTRIIGWMMLLVTLALVAELVIAARVLTERAEAEVDQELVHEGDKLRDYAARAVDPSTGEPYQDVRALLAGYLAEAVPNTDETLFSLVDGQPAHRARSEPLARLDTDPTFVARADVVQPTSGTLTSAAGPVRYAIFPVQVAGDPDSGALVVAEFTAPAAEQVGSTIQVLAVVSVAALALSGVASWLIAGRVLAPIRALRLTADTVHESDLDQRISVSGNDDVAALAHTFNRMLARLQDAFNGQRAFLDDASHELRTPITVIRGHLELIGDDPAERARTLTLVLDEIQRMNRLVDDLMLLAKAERPDFLDLHHQIDVTDLVMEVLTKASALGDRRWTLSGVIDQTVPADGQRLTQALMQLAANAVRHTEPDDEISIGVRVVTDRLRISVADTGTGIAPEDRARIFERFTRVGHRGEQDHRSDGAGLGLAIVASITRAHGGQVLLESTPGKGSTFTLDLPLVRDDDPDRSPPSAAVGLAEARP